jgi:hypothetical protein
MAQPLALVSGLLLLLATGKLRRDDPDAPILVLTQQAGNGQASRGLRSWKLLRSAHRGPTSADGAMAIHGWVRIRWFMHALETMNVGFGRTSLVVAASDGPGG